MNDKLLKLAEEARVIDISSEITVSENISVTDIERFAFLIVHECAEIAWESYINDNGIGPGGCATRPIRKHFGIE